MKDAAIYSSQFTNSELLLHLERHYSTYTQNSILLVNILRQQLYHLQNCHLFNVYTISSAANGTGNVDGSGKTPLGAHFIREKYGEDAAIGSQFRGRKLTGQIKKIITAPEERSDGDNITSRIMWLSGLESGYNQGQGIDSYHRYIYIHGTDEENLLGTPASHGCIRMANQDIIDLYPAVDEKTLVYIYEQ